MSYLVFFLCELVVVLSCLFVNFHAISSHAMVLFVAYGPLIVLFVSRMGVLVGPRGLAAPSGKTAEVRRNDKVCQRVPVLHGAQG